MTTKWQKWLNKFYPVAANSPQAQKSELVRIEHALTKWRGLRPAQMRKYGLEKNGYSVESRDGELGISGESCSLCVKHFNIAEYLNSCCATCPIKVLTGTSCGSEFLDWENAGDPEPMIKLLERVRRLFLKQTRTRK